MNPTKTVDPPVTITERARLAVLSARAGQPDAAELALWLEVSGEEAGEYTYDMYLMSVDEAGIRHLVQSHDDLSIVIPQESVEKVRGATVDLAEDAGYRAWVLHNPNKPAVVRGPIISPASLMRKPQADPVVGGSPAMRPPSGEPLTGETAQKVNWVIQNQINPSIASHGGAAELVAIDNGTAYLRLSGGCQGCAMASVTLTQGIKVAIIDAVPEITEVADVTDHASGSNPYFESAKK